MRAGLLAEELCRRGAPVYLGGATPKCWERLKKDFNSLDIQYVAMELAPEDGPIEWLILASASFRGGDVPQVAKRIELGRSARKLTSREGSGWILSMAKTATDEGYQTEASELWGRLVTEERKKEA